MKTHPLNFLLLLAFFLFSCNSQPSENSKVTTAGNPKAELSTQEETIPEKATASIIPAPEKLAATKPELKPEKRKLKKTEPAQNRTEVTSTSLAAAPKIFTEPEPEKALTVADIYRHFEKAPQTFNLPLNKDTTIICREGTSLYIPASAFVSEKTGKEVTGPVQLSVKEYYQLSDMLLANLSTRSGNDILETGGMLHLSATSADNQNLVLKPDQQIEIGFPYEKQKPDMQLFLGDWKDEIVDWRVTGTKAEDHIGADFIDEDTIQYRASIFRFVEQMPVFPGGEEALAKYLAVNVKRPFSALGKIINGTIYASFTVNESGNISDITILRGVDSAMDKSAVYAISNMPKWKPGRQNNAPVPVMYNLPIRISFDAAIDTTKILQSKLIADAKNFENKIKDITVTYGNRALALNDKTFQEEFERKLNNPENKKASTSEISRYLLSTSQLGWINCDRFIMDKRPKTDFAINLQGAANTQIKVVFHSFKAVLYVSPNSSFTKFSSGLVPLGEKITIVAVKTEENKILLAVKETTIKKEGENDLIFEPVTLARLKAEMEKLNRIN